jgi:regulator of protease activity HflC (stomatin/prohibitin superfamily)
VYLQVSVQYQVVPQKVEFAFYSLENPHQQIASYIFDEVRAAVPKNDLDDVFEKKDDIAVAVKHNIAEQMSNYGFQIIKALITDINPDTKVKEAMNRINAARRDKIAALEEAEGHKIKVVKAAEAEAESKRLSGKGIAEQRLEIVHGFRTSIEEFQKNLNTVSHAEVMQFMLMTQYFDMLNNIGSNGKNSSIIVPHSPASLKEIQDQIIQGTIIGQEINRDTKHNI